MPTYSNLRYWDGVSDDYSEESAISTKQDRFVEQNTADPKSRDCSGLTVIPGLIDAHVHMTLDPSIKSVEDQIAQTEEEILAKMPSRANRMLSAGITTARDLGGANWLELQLRDQIDHGVIRGPRLICAGRPLTSKGGHCFFWGGEVSTTGEFERLILENQVKKSDLIKVMATGGMATKQSTPGKAQFTLEEIRHIVDFATQCGYTVAAHCHGTEGIKNAVLAGVHTVEHCSWLSTDSRPGPVDVPTVSAMADRNTVISPTINSGWSRFKGKRSQNLRFRQRQFQILRDYAVRLIASTDAGIPNVEHDDLPKALPVFAEYAKLSNLEVLRSATSDAADALAITPPTGRIQPGYSADAVFLEGDPLNDLGALTRVSMVLKSGVEFLPLAN